MKQNKRFFKYLNLCIEIDLITNLFLLSESVTLFKVKMSK